MSSSPSSRREFLRSSAAATAALSFASIATGQETPGAHPSSTSTLERRRFGKTDMNVAVLGFGGAEIRHEKTEQETGGEILNPPLDARLNLADTAEGYISSEGQNGTAVGPPLTEA